MTQGLQNEPAPASQVTRLQETAQEERLRLKQAIGVLDCLIFSLACKPESRREELRGMDSAALAGMAKVARDLVNRAMRRLDSAAIETETLARLTGARAPGTQNR